MVASPMKATRRAVGAGIRFAVVLRRAVRLPPAGPNGLLPPTRPSSQRHRKNYRIHRFRPSEFGLPTQVAQSENLLIRWAVLAAEEFPYLRGFRTLTTERVLATRRKT